LIQSAGTGDVETDSCWPLDAGFHRARFYTRETGARITGFALVQVPQPRILQVKGCGKGCHRDGRDLLTITVANFCGPSMMHIHLVIVHGLPCRTPTLVNRDTIQCTTPPREDASNDDTELLVKLNVIDQTTQHLTTVDTAVLPS
jgi:hypothetical protein